MEQIGIGRKKIILLLAGSNLMILQFMMLRNFSALLFGTEMILLITTLAYFSGISLGFWVSDRLSRGVLEAASVLALPLHLTLPFSLRVLAGFLLARDWKLGSLIALIFIGALFVSSFYSILLPRFIQE